MLLKVRRGPREKLQAIVGTKKSKLEDFSDSDCEENKAISATLTSQQFLTKSLIKRRPKAKN